MFVCICNGITERQILEAIDRGATTLPELTATLGIASGCGTCAQYAHELLSAPGLPADQRATACAA